MIGASRHAHACRRGAHLPYLGSETVGGQTTEIIHALRTVNFLKVMHRCPLMNINLQSQGHYWGT